MPVEKSAGAIIFRKENNEIFYLLLHYPSRKRGEAERSGRDETKSQRTSAKAARDYWDFPKGHVEKGEKEIDAAKREIEEETGLKDVAFVDGFKSGIKYFFKFKNQNILKFVTFYLGQTKTKDVKISDEHIGYQWLLYEDALKKLKFKNAKEILQRANEFLIKMVI